ncbi:hypothetical protein [Chryseobacterium indologenes]|uniref:hypothetical protein n=1 Tax=Chryseobacterium indologenes TaxID=253 RepID=UPI0030192F71
MYTNYDAWEHYEYSINSLHLDLSNPRLKYRNVKLNQTEIIKFLIQHENVYDLAKKISEEGYFVGEEPIICIEGDKKIVLEGNRRIAALKVLQDPSKYLSNTKSKTLQKNILENNIKTDRKIYCHIAPNRFHANPIIYERHKGESLKKWETGNQYAFVADMYYEDGLAIEDIANVLNETVSRILRPLRAYNLFLEAKDILEKEEGLIIEIDNFDFTNLERFYSYEEGRKILGINFNANNGELIINIPREEFNKRLSVIFKRIIDAESFSREFNKEEDKKKYIEDLKTNYNFDLNVSSKEATTQSKSSKQTTSLDEQKGNITSRKKKRRKRSSFFDRIIPNDIEITFNNDKLDSLFDELKTMPNEKYYSFAILLRTYLEQSLYYYLKTNQLFDNLSEKTNEKTLEESKKKVGSVVQYLKNACNIEQAIDIEPIMNILRFNSSKDYSNASLKIMLDYIANNELNKYFDVQQSKNLKSYLTRIKDDLDLAVHNIETYIDLSHNKRAWSHLQPLFLTLSQNINNKN